MAKTTKIDIQGFDNELMIIASTAAMSSMLWHGKSGYGAAANYSFNPGHILPPGQYDLTVIAFNWGGPGNCKAIVTAGTTTTLARNGTATGGIYTNQIPKQI